MKISNKNNTPATDRNPAELSARTAEELPFLPMPPAMDYPEFVRYFQRRLERETGAKRAAALRVEKKSRRIFLLLPAVILLLMCAFCLILRTGYRLRREQAEKARLRAAQSALVQAETEAEEARKKFRKLVFFFRNEGLTAPAKFDEPEIFQHIRNNDTGAVKQWLKNRPSLRKTVDADGRTPLHAAAGLDHAECVKQLLGAGAPVNITDAAGMTPLALAAARGGLRSAQLLLDAGAGSGLADPGIATALPPLHAAAANGKREIVSLLIERGAGVNSRAPDGSTALDHAFKNSDGATCDLLSRYGAENE